MRQPFHHLDERFAALRPLAEVPRPPKGWLRAVRNALGMTTAQFARRLGIAQPSVVELEKSEAERRITLQTLDRAAEALGCRVVYVLIPDKSLETTITERARLVAERNLAAVEQTMQLEDQAVADQTARDEALRGVMAALLKKPARLWDEWSV
jgi:predicted DNA-binding mobile mystery protein A